MIRALYTSATGMDAQQLNIDLIANNLANVNTTGYKRSRADFQDLLYQTLRPAGTVAAAGLEIPTGIQLGHGVRPAAVQKIFVQGDFQRTDNKLDVVIEGDGFFQVLQPNGEVAYTRSGAFKKDGSGNIVTSDGFLLEPSIVIPENATDINIGVDGTVSVVQPGESEPVEIGNIQLANFINPAGLNSVGNNLYLPTGASGTATVGTPGEDGLGVLGQGYLELSNVKIVEEMVNMITSQRAYEINGKSIQTSDTMLGIVSNLRR